ncbi:MAG TPA: hypothetical protein V6D23_17115, partial [Candidatus Obscuribacterales bacterium]
LLVDTYDTIQGIRHAIASGAGLKGIRLDSGDFLGLSREARQMLDTAGMPETKIVVSGDMNEYKIRDLLAAGAPIDLFGVGTELVTSIDAPSLGGVYKLTEVEDGSGGMRQALKLSSSKVSYPGCKQVWRQSDGLFTHDILDLDDQTQPGEALLVKVMAAGEQLVAHPPVAAIQQLALRQLAQLPAPLQDLETAESYSVGIGAGLQERFDTLKNQMIQKEMEK